MKRIFRTSNEQDGSISVINYLNPRSTLIHKVYSALYTRNRYLSVLSSITRLHSLNFLKKQSYSQKDLYDYEIVDAIRI